MTWLLLGLGLVFVIEGLVLALAPSRLEELVELIQKIPPEIRRILGLLAVTFGVLLVWIAQRMGG